MGSSASSSRFTIVIPSFNRPRALARCLEAVARLDCPAGSFSTIVVDDGSSPALAPVVEPFAARCVRQPNRGPAAARNRGVEEAGSEWVAFLDDDCLPAPDWLTRLSAAAEATPDAALGGRVENAFPANPYAAASQFIVDYLIEYYLPRPAAPFFLTSNNLAFPRAALLEAGGFDTSFPMAAGEDRDLCHRWRRQGRALRFVPEAVVRHEHRLGLASFCRQQFNYGRGARLFHHKHSGLGREPWSFYRDLLSYPARHGAGWRTSALMLVSQLAVTAGFMREDWTGRYASPTGKRGQ